MSADLDVSQWAGTDDTLTLTVHDVGDTIYDTVVLLDEIEFEGRLEYLICLAKKTPIGGPAGLGPYIDAAYAAGLFELVTLGGAFGIASSG